MPNNVEQACILLQFHVWHSTSQTILNKHPIMAFKFGSQQWLNHAACTCTLRYFQVWHSQANQQAKDKPNNMHLLQLHWAFNKLNNIHKQVDGIHTHIHIPKHSILVCPNTNISKPSHSQQHTPPKLSFPTTYSCVHNIQRSVMPQQHTTYR